MPASELANVGIVPSPMPRTLDEKWEKGRIALRRKRGSSLLGAFLLAAVIASFRTNHMSRLQTGQIVTVFRIAQIVPVAQL
jgi:hypothetical protein